MNIINLLEQEEKKRIRYRKLAKDCILFHENDVCRNIGIIIEGEVSIISYLDTGKEIIYNTLKKDEIFGNNLLFSSEPYYKGDVLADCDSLIALIGRDDLIDIMQNNRNFLKAYLKIQSDSSKNLNNRIRMLSIPSAEERFRFFMHENHNRISYDSVERLAKKMYLSREVLQRLLGKLEKNNSIIRENKVIILR